MLYKFILRSALAFLAIMYFVFVLLVTVFKAVEGGCKCNSADQSVTCVDPAALPDLTGCTQAKTLYFRAQNFAEFCCELHGVQAGKSECGCLMTVLPNLEQIVLASADKGCCFMQYCSCVQSVNYTSGSGSCATW